MSYFNINRDRSVEQNKIFLVDKLFNMVGSGEIYPTEGLTLNENLNSNWECSFTVYKESNGIINPLWDKIDDFALIKVENVGIFELDTPVTDENCTKKECHGISICEAETSQSTITLEVNTEDDMSREDYYKEFPTVFCRDINDLSVFNEMEKFQDETEFPVSKKKEILRRSSLLHRVFSEMPEYLENIDINKIDTSLRNIQREFSWSETSVQDICQQISEEIECIFIFSKFSRTFEVRDLKEHCEIDNCREIENGICPICKVNGTTQRIKSFGEYSGVSIDTKNLAETITLTGDKDAVKNYFKIEGGDDIITNRISNRLIGNGHVWKIGSLQRTQMSDDLVKALDTREEMMLENNYQEEYDGLWDEWNRLNVQISEYQSGMMPSPEMTDQKADWVFEYLFGDNGKIDYAYASNRYQSDNQIADSIMNYAKLLSPTNHTIEYEELSHTEEQWNNNTVVSTISFKPHIYLDGYYIDDDETKGYVDEYTSPTAITLRVAKGYNVTNGDGVYTTEYYEYLKRVIDTANAKSDITDETITFEPETPYDIDPTAVSYTDIPLKSTHYSKYCYNRLDSFCKAYEACSSVVAKLSSTIATPQETVTLSGEKTIETGKNYVVIPFRSSMSSYKFKKDVTYTFTITSSSSRGFSSDNIYALLTTSANSNPGSSGLQATKYIKQNSHTFSVSFQGNDKEYSYLCIGLSDESDYNYKYLYVFNSIIPSDTDTTETINILKYLKTDGSMGNIQDDLLGKYKNYMELLSGRMKWLDAQINGMKARQDELFNRINEIKDICDMKNCLEKYEKDNNVKHNLWYELCSFKRQDTYKNDNFIGEGIDETTLMENIESLIQRADEEIEKACEVNYSATATIDNLLLLPEFESFWDKFELGNYIHMIIDDKVHKMRLSSISYDYSDLSHCSVEFSDVVKQKVSYEDKVTNILTQAASMATSAKTTARQAEQGAEAKLTVSTIMNDALNIANSKITTADDQTFTIDRYGITGRMIDDVSNEVSPEQIRIVNNLLCFTDDSWAHTKTALGKITYLNQVTKEYETNYGLIADTIIGTLMMSEKLCISDKNGSVYIDGNGITLDGGSIKWKSKLPTSSVEGLDDTVKDFVDAIGDLQSQIDGEITSWFEEYEPTTTNKPASLWVTNEDKIKHEGDLFYNTATGAAYRYIYNSSTKQHEWSVITDTAITEALANAAKAQDTANGKRRVFTTTPTPPYDIGDLWSQGSEGDIMICVVTKLEGQAYSSSDWSKASKYTDDTTAKEALEKAKQGITDAENALSDAKKYADSQDTTLSTNLTTAYEKYSDTSISNFDKAVAEYLQVPGATTIVGGNHVISPYIEGGYLNITNGNKQVIIDPSNQTNTGYIFAVKNGTEFTVGIKADGTTNIKGHLTALSLDLNGNKISSSDINDLDATITGYGYQTANQTKTIIEAYGYQTSSNVKSIVTSYGYQNANEVKSIVEGYGYTTNSSAYQYLIDGKYFLVSGTKLSEITGYTEFADSIVLKSSISSSVKTETITTPGGVTKERTVYTTTIPNSDGTSKTFHTYDDGSYILTNVGIGNGSSDPSSSTSTDTYVMIDKNGCLTADNAVIRGTIYATNGYFSGDITGSAISGGTIAIGDNFLVDKDGYLKGSGAELTGTFNMIGGNVNIETGYSSDDKIELKYKDYNDNLYKKIRLDSDGYLYEIETEPEYDQSTKEIIKINANTIRFLRTTSKVAGYYDYCITAGENGISCKDFDTLTTNKIVANNIKSGTVIRKNMSANMTYYLDVSFDTAFTTIPSIVVTPETINPYAVRVSVTNESTTGFRVYLYRSDTSGNLKVNWIAIA